jgi:hypothetical protein
MKERCCICHNDFLKNEMKETVFNGKTFFYCNGCWKFTEKSENYFNKIDKANEKFFGGEIA